MLTMQGQIAWNKTKKIISSGMIKSRDAWEDRTEQSSLVKFPKYDAASKGLFLKAQLLSLNLIAISPEKIIDQPVKWNV
jgi:hypothetical protein